MAKAVPPCDPIDNCLLRSLPRAEYESLVGAMERIRVEPEQLIYRILAGMIGARRPTVSIVGGMLQKAGLIRISRGRVTILDRPGLEEASCECYGVIRDAFDRFLGSDAPGVGRGSRAYPVA